MTTQEVLNQYKEGKRNFSNVKILECNFTDSNLEGIIFKNANICFGSLRGANLSNSDFSNAKLNWCDISRCNMTNAKFDGASLQWSGLNESTFKNTSFRNADLSRTSILNVNRGGADLTDANLYDIWWSMSDISLDSITETIDKLKSLGLPLALFEAIMKEIKKYEEKWRKHFGISDKKKENKFGEAPLKRKKTAALGEYAENKTEYSDIKDSEYSAELIYGAIKKRLSKMDEILGKV